MTYIVKCPYGKQESDYRQRIKTIGGKTSVFDNFYGSYICTNHRCNMWLDKIVKLINKKK